MLDVASKPTATSNTLPRRAGLRSKVIHKDSNPLNVLVSVADKRVVAGIIGLGDLVRGPRVQDSGEA